MHPTAVREFDRLVSLVVQRAEHMGVLADRRVIRRYWLQCLSATLMRGVGHALHLHYTGRDTAALPTESTQFTVFAADTAIPVWAAGLGGGFGQCAPLVGAAPSLAWCLWPECLELGFW